MASCRESIDSDSDDDESWSVSRGHQPDIGTVAVLIQAAQHYRAQQYGAAHDFYTLAIRMYQEEGLDNLFLFTKMVYKRANCYLELGNYLHAIEDAESVKDLMLFALPERLPKYFGLMIRIEERLGDVRVAFVFSIITRELFPKFNVGKKAMERTRLKVEEFMNKNQANVDSVLELIMKRGVDFYYEANYPVAVAIFNELLSLFFFVFIENVHINRASCYLEMGKLAEAEEDCIQVLRRCPEHEVARVLFSDIKEAKKAKQREQELLSKKDMVKNGAAKKQEVRKKAETTQLPRTTPTTLPKPLDKQLKTQECAEVELHQSPNLKLSKQTEVELTKKQAEVELPQSTKPKLSKQTEEELTKKQAEVKLPQSTKSKKKPKSKKQKKQEKRKDWQEEQEIEQFQKQVSEETREEPSVVSTRKETKQDSVFKSITFDVSAALDAGKKTKKEKKETNVPSTADVPEISIENGASGRSSRSSSISKMLSDGRSVEIKSSTVMAVRTTPIQTEEHWPSLPVPEKNAKSKEKSQEQSMTGGVQTNPDKTGSTAKTREHLVTISPATTTSKVKACELPQSSLNSRMQSVDVVNTKRKDGSRFMVLGNREEFPSLSLTPETSGRAKMNAASTSSLDKIGRKTAFTAKVSSSTSSWQTVGSKTNTKQEQDRGLTKPFPITVPNFPIRRSNSTTSLPMQGTTLHTKLSSTPPAGVDIVCDHFLARNNTLLHGVHEAQKICQECVITAKVHYAFWSTSFRTWRRVRTYPRSVPIAAVLRKCWQFENGKQCFKDPCRFAHGPEIHMWDLERKRALPSAWQQVSQSLNLNNSGQRHEEADRKVVLQQNVQSVNLDKPVQGQGQKEPDRRGALPQFSPSANLSKPVQEQRHEETDRRTVTTAAPGNRLQATRSAQNLGIGCGNNTVRNTFQGQVQRSVFQIACELPKAVMTICKHFVMKNKTRPASIYEKSKVCKGCENRGMAYYAFWSDTFKAWQRVRRLPSNVRATVAFQPCKHFGEGKPCLRDPCTFAHGPECLMWTLEREGVLPLPGQGLFSRAQTSGIQPGMPNQERLTLVTLNQYGIRPPPPGVPNGAYQLCRYIRANDVCRFGRGCRFGHGQEELTHWKLLYEQKRQEQNKLKTKKDSSVEEDLPMVEILRMPENEFSEHREGVHLTCFPEDPNVSINHDNSHHEFHWKFFLRYKANETGHLRQVLLLHHYHRCYRLSNIIVSRRPSVGQHQDLLVIERRENINSMAHNLPQVVSESPGIQQMVAEITVSFRATIFGSFAQCILFDFGSRPLLLKKFNIDVASKDILDALSLVRQEVELENLEWDDGNAEIVRSIVNPVAAKREESLLNTYLLPKGVERLVSAQMVLGNIDRGTYSRTMHQLLFVEEMYMRKQISRFNMSKATLHGMQYFFSEVSMENAGDGELFGSIELTNPVTPVDSAGRLCIRNVQAVFIRHPSVHSKVFEAPIHVLESDCVVVRLSSRLCKALKVYDTADIEVDTMLHLNRIPLCEMHKAVDSIGPLHMEQLFPLPQPIRRKRLLIHWDWLLDPRLNVNQKRVIHAVVSSEPPSSPLVVFGPFGTGKTFTLNQAIRQLLTEKSNRILLCTHSNTAADYHVELLHDYLNLNGIPAAKPLRIYHPKRWLSTVSMAARKYGLVDADGFREPTRNEVIDYRVVITTLSTSQLLMDLNLNHGFFTHILVDEAAQAWEPEALIPLALAGPNTTVVFTGDHMQMSPEVYSNHARNWGLQKSLAERLFDHYHKTGNERFKNEHVMFLTENYRSNDEILKFSSENFYGNKLVARGNNPAHPKLGPLLFFSAKGKDEVQHDNSFLNKAEVYEVVKRVAELAENWPNCWNERNLKEIAVLAPYRYQVQAIREKLRMKDRTLKDITVDTIHNVQGLQFRALFISTVRTSYTAKNLDDESHAAGSCEQLYLEFLSDPKLLNTAVTRAMSLLAVVGDPVSLCTVGDCRDLWLDYIKRCNEHGGLYGTTLIELYKEIKALNASILLNPEAIAFVPQCESQNEANLSSQDAEESKDSQDEALKPSKTYSEFEPDDMQYDPELEATNREMFSPEPEPSAEDDDVEEDIGEMDDFHNEMLDDETVLPQYIDEIIKAFIAKCEETNLKSLPRTSTLSESEFPPLETPSSTVKVKDDTGNSAPRSAWGRLSIGDKLMGSFTSDYKIVRVNGRDEIRLVNPGYEIAPTERAQRMIVNTSRHHNLDPDVLKRYLREDPLRYIACQLRLGSDRYRTSYAIVQDTQTPDIQIKGRVRQAFDRDTVVVDLKVDEDVGDSIEEHGTPLRGTLLGVTDHIINPRERQYVCWADYDNHSLMTPIDRSVTKLFNMSDKSCKDLPIYKIGDLATDRAIKVRMVKRENVLSGKYLFVVKFLQWRPDCIYPLGIATRALPRGVTKDKSMDILYAEHGVRKSFREETMKEVGKKYPTDWKIPANESFRPKVTAAFTIDPVDSKDLDDALSVEKLDDDSFKVGIHIADVSYFIKANDTLDREAFQRGISYYPGGGSECVPMLPPELSMGICSLLPNKDRLAVSLFVRLNEKGEVLDEEDEPKIIRTVLRSCCRLTYMEAQEIIDNDDNLPNEVSSHVQANIRSLSKLAQERRHLRIGEAAFDHLTGKENHEDHAAHELVEEMMILANTVVGTFLSQKLPNLTPIRTQLAPKEHRLNEWVEKYGTIARHSLTLRKHLETVALDAAVMEKITSEKAIVRVQQSVWLEIRNAAEKGDTKQLRELICSDVYHPQLAVANRQLNRIQSKSQYVCTGNESQGNVGHYSMALRNYVQFTSPIRRYMDILVHRLIFTLQASEDGSSLVEDIYNPDEISKICRRCTFFHDNSKKFGKACSRVNLASQLKEKSHETLTFIEAIERNRITLHVAIPDDDHLVGNQTAILFSSLAPASIDNNDDSQQETTLTWKFRIYKAPLDEDNFLPSIKDVDSYPLVEEKADCASDSIQNQDSPELKSLVSKDFSKEDKMVEVQGDDWLKMLDSVKSTDCTVLVQQVQKVDKDIKDMTSVQPCFGQVRYPSVKGEVYHHPHYGKSGQSDVSESDGHFYEKSLTLRQYDMVRVQLSSHLIRGIICPEIQLFKISPHLSICIEHRKHPRDCFAYNARHQASKERYSSIEKYIKAWKPVLAIEAAADAVDQDEGFTIRDLAVVWAVRDNGSIAGRFTLQPSYCKSRQIQFHHGDLVCVKFQYSNTNVMRKASIDVFVAHCIVRATKRKNKDVNENSDMVVKIEVHQSASGIPQMLLDGRHHRCEINVIPLTLPHRRMYETLNELLPDSSPLVHAICKGESPANETFEVPTDKLSLADCLPASQFRPLNKYQDDAVKEALAQPFTLIQGPPGTGKTVTGIHIAYWFTKRNRKLEPSEGVEVAPPQVLYCGPSNKSVDVVTDYLLRIPQMKERILRVHSDQIEQREFPIPNKLNALRQTKSDDELKIPDDNVKEVSLHHVIRQNSPYAKSLREMEEAFAETKRNRERPSEHDVSKYCKLISTAENWVIQKSRKEIILCTCVASGAFRIRTSCNIVQCIVDECGMCMEPESLVPITRSGASQIVLIGDHKQLQPIIHDDVAKSLGLEISMFQRYAKQAMMLRIQYRMHLGICEFPSQQFYKGKLQTADIVRSRRRAPVQFWPALVRDRKDIPIVFCHVQGMEESSVIQTAHSGVKSKSNMGEAKKAVQVAKYLVNKHAKEIARKDVAILSPYREQRTEIETLLKGAYDDIHVTTVIKSQGSEWDYVIISLVRSVAEDEMDYEPSIQWLREHIGFLSDEHQINVALTRARKGLCIIGNKNLLGVDPIWGSLIQHYEANNCVVDESWPWR